MDIARGSLDEYEHSVDNVMYTINNIPGDGIDIDDFESEFAVGCSCDSNCEKECSCVREKMNYLEHCLNEEKLSGLILECNPMCSCSDTCKNRLVQNGPLNCLKTFDCGEKGFGLSTTKFIKKNQFICEYAGEVIGIDKARCRVEENKKKNEMNYILIVSEHIGDNKITTCIDPKYFGNIGRYCNHSCAPNSNLIPVRVESLIPRLCLFANRDINAGEEITFDYAGGLEKNLQSISEKPCVCGSDNCIGFLPHHNI